MVTYIWAGLYVLQEENVDANAKMLAAPGVRMKSPINLLTGPEPAYLRWADENRSFQAGMAASRSLLCLLGFVS